MMTKNVMKCSLLLGVAFAGIATATPVMAQASDGSATGDIIVTARRTDERLQDVPISITVFNQEQISNRNVVTAADLATYTPSLTVNQRFGPEKASYSIRGFVQENSTAPSVGVYFADVVAGRAAGGTASGGNAPVGSFVDLQNVQVLKGPQGTLFGRNTTGGAVLLVPNKPTDRLEGWVEGSVGNYDMWRAQGVLNVPLADTFKVRAVVDRNKRDGYMKNHSGIGPDSFNDVDYFAARLGILADLTPDLENYTVATYSNSFAHGYGARIVACNPNTQVPDVLDSNFQPLTYKPIPATTLLTARSACDQIDRQNARGDGPLDIEVSDPNPYIKLRTWQAINTTTWKVTDNLTIKNIASYGETREQSSFNLNGDNFFVPNVDTINGVSGFALTRVSPFFTTTGAIGGPAIVAPAGARYQHIVLNPWLGHNASQSTFTEELQFQGTTSDGKFVWQAGGYLELSRPLGFSAGRTQAFAQCADAMNLDCTNPLLIGSISQSATKAEFTTTAVFAQATYEFTDQLSLTGGFRYTWDKTEVLAQSTRLSLPTRPGGAAAVRCNDIINFPVAPGSGQGKLVTDPAECSFTFVAKSDKPTWLIDVDYKPTQDILIYAKWARGYRQGGANPTNVGLETWDAEKIDTYEIGAKTTWRGTVPGYFNVAAFYNDFSNQQLVASGVADPRVPGFSGSQPVINAGKSRIQGFEVDGSATFFDSLKLDVGYSYIDSKLKSITVPSFPSPPYSDLIPSAIIGGPLALSPKHRLTLTGTYTLPLDDRYGSISISASYVYTSDQFFSRADDVFIQYFDSSTLPAGQVKFKTADNVDFYNPNLGLLPPTNIVNLNVNWNNVMGAPIDAGFFMTNVTNEIYPVSAGSSTTSNGYETFLYGAPRMWGFRLKYSFGE